MAEKKISPREFHERMKAARRRPHKPELVDKFNRIVENDEKREQQKKPDKKIARPPEADL